MRAWVLVAFLRRTTLQLPRLVRRQHTRRSSQASFHGFDSVDSAPRVLVCQPQLVLLGTGGAPAGIWNPQMDVQHGVCELLRRVVTPEMPYSFEYGRYDFLSYPSSYGISLPVSMTMERVDLDTLSFYLRPPVPAARPRLVQVAGRAHRHNESNMSVGSMVPPASACTTTAPAFIPATRIDYVSSIGSSGHRFAFSLGARACHRAEHSIDSLMSDFAAIRGTHTSLLDDKMLESAQGISRPERCHPASRRMWHGTPFSVYAVQSFDPPAHIPGMRAILEHSQQSHGPLPSDIRAWHMRHDSVRGGDESCDTRGNTRVRVNQTRGSGRRVTALSRPPLSLLRSLYHLINPPPSSSRGLHIRVPLDSFAQQLRVRAVETANGMRGRWTEAQNFSATEKRWE
ncbi:unnamed protein product [Peniophora sp. CBMAI 1063]|nr:unnamed protein product [Peniophora sp. CBMAI 1063]